MAETQRVSENIIQKLRDVPQSPGVYLIRDEAGNIIYVGKAARLRDRLKSHFVEGYLKTPKDDAMVSAARDVEFVELKSEHEALMLENRYIKEYRPRFNISLRDDKGYPYLKVTLNESYPRFIVTRLKKPDGALYLGPYTDAGALRQTIQVLSRIFMIRTCSPAHPGEYDYKHCLYQMMKWCSAPCVGQIDKGSYRKSVEDVCQILLNRSREILGRFRRDMKQASRELDFERAAQLRDRLSALEQIIGFRGGVTLLKPAHADREAESLARELGLDHVPERIEAFDISNFSGREAVGSMVHFYHGKPDKRYYRRFKIQTVAGIDDFAMMREVVSRRYKRLVEDNGTPPDLILIDGGKGQLSSALSALGETGLAGIPMIGLAKRLEEIFTPYTREPIVLRRDSGALHLIQRIRDEAHRFAVSYHRDLRARKLRESVLDDIPGVGPSKKNALLGRFHSVDAMMKATPEEIEKTPGISVGLAARIYGHLHYVVSPRLISSKMSETKGRGP